MAASATALLPASTATPPPPAGGAYIALGDSVTYGVGVASPREQGYVARLSERLAAAQPPITQTRVFAVPGETAGGFLDRHLDDVLDAIHELGPRVEVVTVGLGANELLQIRRDPACRDDRTDPACVAAASAAIDRAATAVDALLVAVQDALATSGSTARVLVLAYYNPDVEPIAVSTLVGADGMVACDPADTAPGLNDRIACVAADRGVELVDLYAAFLGREHELTNIGRRDVHPNAGGHAMIAAEIAAVLGAPEERP